MQLFGAFLRGRDFWFDLVPFCQDRVELALDLDRLVGVPAVVKEEDRAEGDERENAELQRIALTLALFGNFLV